MVQRLKAESMRKFALYCQRRFKFWVFYLQCTLNMYVVSPNISTKACTWAWRAVRVSIQRSVCR